MYVGMYTHTDILSTYTHGICMYIHTYICTDIMSTYIHTVHVHHPTNLFHAESDTCYKGSIVHKGNPKDQSMGQHVICREDDDKEDIKGTREEPMETGPHLEEGGEGRRQDEGNWNITTQALHLN